VVIDTPLGWKLEKVSKSINTISIHNLTNPFQPPLDPPRAANLLNMAPKQQRIQVAKADVRRPAQKGYLSSTYQTLTSPENASVVRSVAVFGVAVAFFSSSWSEFLLPPL